MEIAHVATIDAPVDRVWALTLDIDALSDITRTVTAIERLDEGPLHVGSRARLTQPGLGRRVWTIEELAAPSRFVWATRLLGSRMAGVHEVAALDEERCELTLRVVLEGPTAWLLARLGGRSIARSLAVEADGFARAAAGLSA